MSFLAPLGLLLGLLALPLAALYFLRLRRRKVRVSSLMLWHAVRKSEQLASPFQRFRRHVLLLLQLLVLAALVLAFARPFLQTETSLSRSVVLLLDTSASMGATDGAPLRFDTARAEARALLDELGPADEAMIVTAGPATEVVAPFSRDKGALRLALEGVEVTQAEGSLEEGLRLALSLARTRADVEVVVLSDGGPDDLGGLPAGAADVRYRKVGSSETNAGILALDLRRSTVSEQLQQLFLTVQSFGGPEGRGTVEVYLDSELVGMRTERLAPGDPVAMVFDLPVGATGVLRAHLTLPGDQLPADDEAFALLDRRAAHDVLLVGGDALLSRLLANDPRIDARRVAAHAVTPELLQTADAVLFAGAVPDRGLDGLSYAVLGPQHGGPVRFGGVKAAPRVLDWRRAHPLLRFTQWDRLVITESHAVEDAAGLVAVVEGDWGPLVLAGERRGGRVVQLAFDPFRSDLPLRVAWPVFVMNTVGWLTEGDQGEAAGQLSTGSAWVRTVLDAQGTPVVSGPGRPVARLDDDVLRVTGLTQVGLYEVRLGALRERIAANLLSADESRIAPRANLTLAGGDADGVAQASVGRQELWRPLLFLALALLLLEWFVYHRKAVA